MKVIAISALIATATAKGNGKRSNLCVNEKTQILKKCDAIKSGAAQDNYLSDMFCAHAPDAIEAWCMDENNVSDQQVNDFLVKNQCEGSSCQTGTLNLEALFGYGCWCFFGNIDSTLGRGPPVDSYDATCQKLSLCYRCIFVDADNESDECDPFTQEFAATISLGGFGGSGVSNATISCQTDNQSTCAWRTCSCAMTMINSFFNLSFDSSSVYDDNLKHENGFDYNLECPQQGRAQDRQCCGFYPDRRTYDRGEARDCCHQRSIYNPLRHVCCDDGNHIGIGHSC